jgi:anti-anti-sigma factor
MVIDRQNDVSVVHTPIRLSGKSVNELLSSVRQQHQNGVAHIIIDLNDTEFIDSSGIGSFVSMTKEFKGTKTEFALRNLKKEIKALFCETGLDMIFNIETAAGIDKAKQDIFDTGVDIRLEISQEIDRDICIFHLSGVMNHPVGSRYFKQQFLLAMTDYKKLLIDFENLTFFDSLSVSVILNMNKLLKETGGSLRMCAANYIVSDLFLTLNIKQIIPVFDNLELAKADWH